MTNNTWYDESGNVLKSQPAGAQTWTKMTYDAAGRTVMRYAGLSTETENWAEAGTVETSLVFEQSETVYDEASNVIQTNTAQRFHSDDSTEGALIVPPTTDYFARPGYMVMYPDGIGRVVNAANYGTNDNGTFTRDDIAPTRSDDILVSSTGYNIRGEAVMTIDPAEKISLQFFDDAGRRVQLIENYVESGTDPDQNRTTTWEYNADGQLVALSAVNSITGLQVTQYQYGVSLAGSTVASNNLLHSVTYPDGGTVVNEYNRSGQRIRLTDQNATVHEFDFDLLGRQTADRVTQVGLGIDGAVRCIGLSYEVRGMVQNITSYSTPLADGDFVVNQVRNDYRDFMQNAGQNQEHNGAVVLGTTLRTIYDYIDGSGNTARFWRYSFPDESGTFSYSYDSTDSISDRLSRPISTTAQYSLLYLGLSTMVENRRYRGQLICWSLILGSDATNPYGGLDRFGRVIDSKWTAPDISTTLDQIQYGYDRVGNRIWRYNVVAHTNSADFDEQYSYDGLNQLTVMQRGSYSTAPTLPSTPPSGFSGTPTFQQTWMLDSTGNWDGFTESVSGTTTLNQSRMANRVNEITQITHTGTDPQWTQPVYDAAGNMTIMPQPSSAGDGFAAVYDAWNRLVRIDEISGESPVTLQENAYDGLTRRVSKTTFGETGEIRHYYYDIDWRVIEEYVGATPNRDNREDWNRQNLWGLRYIDELVTQLRAVPESAPVPFVPLQDANFNVTALCAGDAAIIERYAYSAYGTPQFLDSTFTPLMTNASAYDFETLYCGYRYDAGTGLYHVRYRMLHSVIGLWLTMDPFPNQGRNQYAYVDAYPITLLDPWGLAKCSVDKVSRTIKAPVGLYNDDNGDTKLAFSFALSAVFKSGGDCDCKCCSFRQYVASQTGLYGKNKVSGIMSRVLTRVVNGKTVSAFYQKGALTEHGWSYVEDVDAGGAAYGHREQKQLEGDVYSTDGCNYTMDDTPSFNKIREQMTLFGTGEGRIDIGADYSFRQRIIDTCNDGKVIWEDYLDVSALIEVTGATTKLTVYHQPSSYP